MTPHVHPLFRRGFAAALLFLLVGFSVTLGRAADPEVILLWPQGAPGSEGKTGEEHVRITEAGEHVVSSVHRPSLTVYLPSKHKATGAAVLVIPGGGHRELWMDHEGYNVARWLNDHGVAAFILKYRLSAEQGSTYTVEGHSLADGQRALRLIRRRAGEWGVDPQRLGVIGFSAGGELAALVAQHTDRGTADAKDPIDREPAKVAFQGLIYPGRAQTIIPTRESPPAFLVAGYQDDPKISEGLANVYLLFKKAGVPAELHMYSDAGHGFGVRATNHGPASAWIDRFYEWMEGRGLLKR